MTKNDIINPADVLEGGIFTGQIRVPNMVVTSPDDVANCAIWFWGNNNEDTARKYWKIGVQTQNYNFMMSPYNTAGELQAIKFSLSTSGNLTIGGSLSQGSSKLIKHDIDPLKFDCGKIIDAMQPVSFKYNSDPEEKTQYGFIYEDLIKIAPDLCTIPQNESELPSIKYTNIIPLLVKETQQLRKRVANLEKQLEEIKNEQLESK